MSKHTSRLARLKHRLTTIGTALGGLLLMVRWWPLAIIATPFILFCDWLSGEKDEADDL